MFGRDHLKLSIAKTIVIEEHLTIKATGGSVAEAQLASFNRLREEGLEDLAHLLVLYHTGLMDLQPPKGNVSVSISNSTVGSVAFDSEVSNITTSVSTLTQRGGDSAEFAKALKQLTEAVTGNTEISAEKKKEILELVDTIGQQAQEPPEKRKKTILQYVLDGLPKALGAASSLASLWHSIGPTIAGYF